MWLWYLKLTVGWGWGGDGGMLYSIHYSRMSVVLSQNKIWSMACSGWEQRKHQNPSLLAICRGIHYHWWPGDWWIALTKKTSKLGIAFFLEESVAEHLCGESTDSSPTLSSKQCQRRLHVMCVSRGASKLSYRTTTWFARMDACNHILDCFTV